MLAEIIRLGILWLAYIKSKKTIEATHYETTTWHHYLWLTHRRF